MGTSANSMFLHTHHSLIPSTIGSQVCGQHLACVNYFSLVYFSALLSDLKRSHTHEQPHSFSPHVLHDCLTLLSCCNADIGKERNLFFEISPARPSRAAASHGQTLLADSVRPAKLLLILMATYRNSVKIRYTPSAPLDLFLLAYCPFHSSYLPPVGLWEMTPLL